MPSNSSGFMHGEKGEGKGTPVRPAPRDGTGRDGGGLKHFWDKVTTMGPALRFDHPWHSWKAKPEKQSPKL